MAKFNLISFLRTQWTTMPVPSTDISDKSIVVIGANVGLGFEAVVRLGKLGPRRLLLTTRDEAKCKQAKQDVEERSTFTGVEAWPLELGSFDSVRRFADRVESEGFPINALIANASIGTMTYAKTEDGWETTLQVNYLSNALLSILMLPHLIKSATPTDASRLVIVSSEAHVLASNLRVQGSADWTSILGRLNNKEYCTTFVMMNRYVHTKMLQIMFVRELASRLPGSTPVSVTAVNPGLCHSRVFRYVEGIPIFNVILYLGNALIARSTEMGSRTLVHPAVEPGERDRHGRYVSSCEVAEVSDYILSEEGKEVSRRLWTETVEILGKIDPRVNRIIAEHLLSH